MFQVLLPVPVSANHLFLNVTGKGRRKTKAYEDWQKAAILTIYAQVRADRRVAGKTWISILLPEDCGLDADNAIKPILDSLVHSRRIDDDRHVMRLEVEKGGATDNVVVTVREWTADVRAAA